MMKISRVMEYVFFFGLLALAGYMVWRIMAPFITALALAAIIATIFYPLYIRLLDVMPKKSRTLAALITTFSVLLVIILPLVLMSSVIVKEVVSFYQEVNVSETHKVQDAFNFFEASVQSVIPGYDINAKEQIKAISEWVVGNIGIVFAGTLSTLFTFVIAMVGSFYFFRDGKDFMQSLIKASPLPDKEDEVIFDRMARGVRGVATGTLLIALLQGILVGLGFTIFGIDRAILWGSFASVGALMPGIGTTIVTAPAIIYLFTTGSTVYAFGLLMWSVLVVGLVDNVVGPYLIGRNNNVHPFVILISVLGGISMFGPIGFIVGPVIVILFIVLLEVYNQYIIKDEPVSHKKP